jgi:hypothetical protein
MANVDRIEATAVEVGILPNRGVSLTLESKRGVQQIVLTPDQARALARSLGEAAILSNVSIVRE